MPRCNRECTLEDKSVSKLTTMRMDKTHSVAKTIERSKIGQNNLKRSKFILMSARAILRSLHVQADYTSET